MIVRLSDGHIQLITQPDHARLAREIIQHCAGLDGHPRRDAILYATSEHDNGWAEEDARPTVDPSSGRIVDFVSAPLRVRQAVWPRAIDRLAATPWAAALVAQHALTVYDRFRAESAWAPFFSGMAQARTAMLEASGMAIEDLIADYRFVRLGDLISLVFCMGTVDEHRFGEWSVRLTGDRVVVTPDPFGGVEIPIGIPARVIGERECRSDADLLDALSRADRATLRGEVAGPSGAGP